MDRDELFACAAPPCGECGEPVQRAEITWRLDDEGRWRLAPAFMVCAKGHRVLVEVL